MANITITNVDLGSVITKDAQFRDALLEILAADTILEGTILARRTVAAVVVGAPDGSNTGNGTITALSVAEGPVVPLVGVYLLTYTEVIVEGGVFELTDPNGAIVGSALLLDPAGEATTAFNIAGLKFSIVEGATDFALDDFFTITVAANGKIVPFDPAGSGGAQIPLSILTFEVVTTGAEDVPIQMAVSGFFRKERLVIDGDLPNVGLTDAILDSLRVYDLVPIDTLQLSILDNQ